MTKMCKRLMRDKKFLSLLAGVLVLAILAVAWFVFNNKKEYQELSIREASLVTENFINSYLMPSGSQASVTASSEEYDLYKLVIDIGNEDPVESYVTKDGRLFFPQALEIEAVGKADANPAARQAPTPINVPKSDKPEVELFVMSYCPFGTQMLKGLLPVLETLGDNIDFKLKFNDYAMHEKVELDENLVQYCVQKEEPENLNAYLTCFLEAGDRENCLTENTNVKNINSCVTATDKEFKVTENYNNKVDWKGNFPGFSVHKEDNAKYSVGGSPTLIINGTNVSSARDSASLLNTICSAFNEAPEACSAQLNNQSPTPGFGFDFSAASTEASCL